MPHTKDMNLLEALYQSTAEFHGEPIEQVRERMERLPKPEWTAEDEAGLGEDMAERVRDWHEDNLPR